MSSVVVSVAPSEAVLDRSAAATRRNQLLGVVLLALLGCVGALYWLLEPSFHDASPADPRPGASSGNVPGSSPGTSSGAPPGTSSETSAGTESGEPSGSPGSQVSGGPVPSHRPAVVESGNASISAAAAAPNFTFLVLGDWGGDADWDPCNDKERAVIKGMSKHSQVHKPSFALLVGDNFYQEGVGSNTYADRFRETFEEAFQHPAFQIPFYAIAGNHDYYGDVNLEIQYTGQGSGRWNFPELYYTVRKTLPSGHTLEIAMFDSVMLHGHSYRHTNGTFVQPRGPDDASAAQRQWEWLERTLASSTADYLFTAAHYPVYSTCNHGSVMSHTALPELLSKYRVNGHLAGHDHCLVHVVDGGVHHVLSGAGSRAWYESAQPLRTSSAKLQFEMDWSKSQGYAGGFASIAIINNGTSAVANYYGSDGTELFSSSPIFPRTQPSSARLNGIGGASVFI